MRRFFLLGLLIMVALNGCAGATDPIVGTWRGDNLKIICNSNGTGVHRFDRDDFYEINKTYDGFETKFRWEKTGQNTYMFYYLYPTRVYKEQGVIQNGELVFDQGDYANHFKK
jgi:hypothetical protein